MNNSIEMVQTNVKMLSYVERKSYWEEYLWNGDSNAQILMWYLYIEQNPQQIMLV